ncbi:hypothetical protein FCU94_07440 [Vibrio sp. JPW-9-11-11]|uniref:hypothetical protein n=1 Tax=Vibrio sp. JPW-9-11-11 TaxID=1416532 RepID=UPI00159483EA|nr:hypothetical protein [Vibrio sp. JPW-9-11-11]NVD06745.1 hypothetical protein [Vibrio sp. JPW-9-11-11]
MNKLTSLFIALFAAVSFHLVAAEEEADVNNRTKVAPNVEDMDNDGDGLVSQDEFNQFRLGSSEPQEEEEQEGIESDEDENRSGLSAFASFDKDKDGFVTQEELNAHAKYSNPGNGTGELKTQKQQLRSSNEAGSQSKSNSKGSGNSNKGGGSSNRGGGNKGGGDKGGKGKDK